MPKHTIRPSKPARRSTGAPLHRARPSFDDLCAREPRLARLMQKIKTIKDDRRRKSFCANWHWYGYEKGDGGFRDRVQRLVGWSRKPHDELLSTSDAYDVAGLTLYNELPDCRNCGCIFLRDLRDSFAAEK